MSLTFKQYHAFLDVPLDADEEQLSEIFGMFKNADEKKKAELAKLELLAKKGNEQAKMKLRDLQLKADKEAAAKGAAEKTAADRFKTAKAYADAADKGSSDAYRKETGSVRSAETPVWDAKSKTWVARTKWGHVGKHD